MMICDCDYIVIMETEACPYCRGSQGVAIGNGWEKPCPPCGGTGKTGWVKPTGAVIEVATGKRVG